MTSLKIQKKQHFLLRKHVIFCITFIIFSSAFTLIFYINYINVQNVPIFEPIIMYFEPVNNNILCHYEYGNDALPSAEDENFFPENNSIFFHETSCRGGIDSRQACAIESASRAHPNRQVYVMISGPVSKLVYEKSNIALLRSLPNVRFARVHINEYVKDSPLEDMIANRPFLTSPWRVEHSSDILRYLTMYKWGGVYLDTDMLVVKSLTPLGPNWVARESYDLLNAAAIAISMDHVGRTLANALINEVRVTYDPSLWTHNGPGSITRVINRMCKRSAGLVDWLTKETCKGLIVYDREYFYPMYFSAYRYYFQPGELLNFENAYTHHFWNKMSHNVEIDMDSPYAKLAEEFCPMIYEMYKENFGK